MKKGEDLIRALLHEYNENRRIKESGEDSPEAAAARRVNLIDLKHKLQAHALTGPDKYSKSRGIKKRFMERGEEFFLFLDDPDVPSTNNLAEGAIRSHAIWKHVSFGTQSFSGNCFLEVFHTILQTLNLKGMQLMRFLAEALTAGSDGKPLPSLVNQGQAVDPKFVKAADEHYRTMKKLEADANRALKEELEESGAVRPFLDGSETSSAPLGSGGTMPMPKARKSRAVRPGSGAAPGMPGERGPDGPPAEGVRPGTPGGGPVPDDFPPEDPRDVDASGESSREAGAAGSPAGTRPAAVKRRRAGPGSRNGGTGRKSRRRNPSQGPAGRKSLNAGRAGVPDAPSDRTDGGQREAGPGRPCSGCGDRKVRILGSRGRTDPAAGERPETRPAGNANPERALRKPSPVPAGPKTSDVRSGAAASGAASSSRKSLEAAPKQALASGRARRKDHPPQPSRRPQGPLEGILGLASRGVSHSPGKLPARSLSLRRRLP